MSTLTSYEAFKNATMSLKRMHDIIETNDMNDDEYISRSAMAHTLALEIQEYLDSQDAYIRPQATQSLANRNHQRGGNAS